MPPLQDSSRTRAPFLAVQLHRKALERSNLGHLENEGGGINVSDDKIHALRIAHGADPEAN